MLGIYKTIEQLTVSSIGHSGDEVVKIEGKYATRRGLSETGNDRVITSVPPY